MKTTYLSIALIAIFIILAIIGLNRKSYWEQPPDIFICKQSTVSANTVREARKMFEDLGHEFGLTIEDWPCQMNVETNHIYIDNTIFIYPEHKISTKRTDGVIRRSYKNHTFKREYKSAIIETDTDNHLIIAHELGHALGFNHVNEIGHLMYPNSYGIGENMMGMRK